MVKIQCGGMNYVRGRRGLSAINKSTFNKKSYWTDQKRFEPSMTESSGLGRRFCPCTSSQRRRDGIGRGSQGAKNFCLGYCASPARPSPRSFGMGCWCIGPKPDTRTFDLA
jgi:hypothetical protein